MIITIERALAGGYQAKIRVELGYKAELVSAHPSSTVQLAQESVEALFGPLDWQAPGPQGAKYTFSCAIVTLISTK